MGRYYIFEKGYGFSGETRKGLCWLRSLFKNDRWYFWQLFSSTNTLRDNSTLAVIIARVSKLSSLSGNKFYSSAHIFIKNTEIYNCVVL